MSERKLQLISSFAGLAMLLFGAVAAFDWLNTVKPVGGIKLPQIFAGLATLSGVLSRWAAHQMTPPQKNQDKPNAP